MSLANVMRLTCGGRSISPKLPRQWHGRRQVQLLLGCDRAFSPLWVASRSARISQPTPSLIRASPG